MHMAHMQAAYKMSKLKKTSTKPTLFYLNSKVGQKACLVIIKNILMLSLFNIRFLNLKKTEINTFVSTSIFCPD